MFAKLYSNIVDSTLMDQPVNVRYVFMMMLAIADRDGYVASTPKAAAARLNIDQDAFDQAIQTLMAPDPNSNFPDHEGRRLVPSDRGRGWLIVTYKHYSDIRNEEHKRQYMREYMRNYRAKQKDVKTNGKDDKDFTNYGAVTSLALLDVDADAERDAEVDKNEMETKMRIKSDEFEPSSSFHEEIPF
jgi:hypothetical protein